MKQTLEDYHYWCKNIGALPFTLGLDIKNTEAIISNIKLHLTKIKESMINIEKLLDNKGEIKCKKTQ